MSWRTQLISSIKGVSGGGKSFTALHTLALVGQDFVNQLTSSSALSLVYDTRPLAHTVMLLFEANQMQADKQADKDSTFAMLVRTLISEGRIVHQRGVEDPNLGWVGASSASCVKVE